MNIQWGLIILLVILALGGCGSNPSSQYYRLPLPLPESVSSQWESEGSIQSNYAVVDWGLWPVELPREIRREEIVTFPTSLQAEFSPRQRWSMALNEQIDRLLTLELASHFPIWRYPWPIGERPERQVRLHLLHFGGPLSGPVSIDAEWWLTSSETDSPTVLWRFHRQEILNGDGYRAYVDGMERLLRKLAAELVISMQQQDSSDLNK